MRDLTKPNPNQKSVYVIDEDWEAAREMARLGGQSISAFLVRLIRRERAKVLGKDWTPQRSEK